MTLEAPLTYLATANCAGSDAPSSDVAAGDGAASLLTAAAEQKQQQQQRSAGRDNKLIKTCLICNLYAEQGSTRAGSRGGGRVRSSSVIGNGIGMHSMISTYTDMHAYASVRVCTYKYVHVCSFCLAEHCESRRQKETSIALQLTECCRDLLDTGCQMCLVEIKVVITLNLQDKFSRYGNPILDNRHSSLESC